MTEAHQDRLLLFAPNVHIGGGLVLLQELLDAWPEGAALQAWLDERARSQLRVPVQAEVIWTRATLTSRFRAEWSLWRKAQSGDRLLCFHGLPPLLCRRAPAFVFLQNYYYLGNVPLEQCTWRVRVRSRAEQLLSRMMKPYVARYLVQSPTMLRKLRDWYGAGEAPVDVLPLVPKLPPAASRSAAADWDFIYVADGQMHKNHRRLIEAWQLLAERGQMPSLALPLPDRDHELRAWIDAQAREHGLRVTTMNPMPHAEVLKLYASSRALLFPSTGESFGLPLYEAARLGLPIVASERDYVRDVCEPVQTFDPESATSIARAVARFLGETEPALEVVGATAFLRSIRTAKL